MSATLIDRLREAKEGTAELDARIWCEVHDAEFVVDVADGRAIAKKRVGLFDGLIRRDYLFLGWVDPGEHSLNFYFVAPSEFPEPLPRYTRSLDASIALCERVLPGWQINTNVYGRFAEACLGDPSQNRWCAASTPALALVLAILTAVQQEKKDAGASGLPA